MPSDQVGDSTRKSVSSPGPSRDEPPPDPAPRDLTKGQRDPMPNADQFERWERSPRHRTTPTLPLATHPVPGKPLSNRKKFFPQLNREVRLATFGPSAGKATSHARRLPTDPSLSRSPPAGHSGRGLCTAIRDKEESSPKRLAHATRSCQLFCPVCVDRHPNWLSSRSC